MNDFGNIEKRIKRHVLGKNRNFFISTQPGLEKLCLKEFQSLGFSTDNFDLVRGGIEFTGRVHECYLANLKLRTASRILMRIESFKATNFRQLKKKLIALPWELYLHKGTSFEVNVTSKHSRLFHTDAVSEQFKACITDRLNHINDDNAIPHDTIKLSQQIFVRILDDRFTLSIDSSGGLLHKRNLKKQGGTAPIRETIAAAILLYSGYGSNSPLLDPMCGTGTFSLEAAMIANQIPAGWYRHFAFMEWPSFKASRWKHIRREAEKSIIQIENPIIFASDNNRNNILKLDKIIRENDLTGTISACQMDFFDLQPSDNDELLKIKKTGLIILNPPYGRRLKPTDGPDKFVLEICGKLKSDFKGWDFALVLANKNLSKKIPFKATTHDLFHGGLALTLLTGKIH